MNKHFEDARYYLKRAAETATRGVREELEPVERRFNELVGDTEDPDTGRLDDIRAELKVIGERTEGEARAAIEDAREQIAEYRKAE